MSRPMRASWIEILLGQSFRLEQPVEAHAGLVD